MSIETLKVSYKKNDFFKNKFIIHGQPAELHIQTKHQNTVRF